MKGLAIPALLALLTGAGPVKAEPTADAALALRALQAACPVADAAMAVAVLRDAAGEEAAGEAQIQPIELGLGLAGWQATLGLREGGTIRLSRLASGASLQRAVVEIDRPAGPGLPPRPTLQARAERDCARLEGRALLRRADGSPEAVTLLDEKLEPTGTRLPLDADVPPGVDPGGVTVALLDTGVNYLQPKIGERLARRADGAIVGYDFEDDDARPFDANVALSPFHPGRHGTLVANALLDEAAALRLVPLRFPRSDPARLEQAVALAADAGASILLVGVGGRRAEDWQGFAAAMRAHPGLLAIVSAGRDGEDIDDRAWYPAALELPNMLVVGAADGFGQPVRSNWGLRRVDILAPAERLIVRDFDDVEQAVAGAEFAAARIAALATRLLAAEPALTAAELKARLLSMARLSDHGARPRSAYGVVPEEALAR